MHIPIIIGNLHKVAFGTVNRRPGSVSSSAKERSGTIHLTVWQNLLISDIPEGDAAAVKAELEALGLHWRATHVRAALVACTGNTGCKFSATDTKRHALDIADHLEGRSTITNRSTCT